MGDAFQRVLQFALQDEVKESEHQRQQGQMAEEGLDGVFSGKLAEMGVVGINLKRADAALGSGRVRDRHAAWLASRGSGAAAVLERLTGERFKPHQGDIRALGDGLEQPADRLGFDVPDGDGEQGGVRLGKFIKRFALLALFGRVLPQPLNERDEDGSENRESGRFTQDAASKGLEIPIGHGGLPEGGASSRRRNEKS